ncbi:MAG: hypothetical protein KIT31_32995 [Deltaproteobacteria bacterium]|nr:hypothetical protein [Deltaproteobacteria bacterium]
MRVAAFLVLAGCWAGSSPPPAPAPAAPAEEELLPGGPFATRELRGPYRDVGAWCGEVAHRTKTAGAGCVATAVTSGPVAAGPSANPERSAIRDAHLAAFQVEPDAMWGPRCALVLRTAAGVWVHEDVETCLGGTIVRSVVVDELGWRDVVERPGEAAGRELVLQVTRTRASGGGRDVTTTNMIVCGVGARAVPRCTPPIPVAIRGVVSDTAFHPTISPRGELAFQLDDGDGGTAADDKRFARTHELRFP